MLIVLNVTKVLNMTDKTPVFSAKKDLHLYFSAGCQIIKNQTKNPALSMVATFVLKINHFASKPLHFMRFKEFTNDNIDSFFCFEFFVICV